jgi:hypothetical protein
MIKVPTRRTKQLRSPTNEKETNEKDPKTEHGVAYRLAMSLFGIETTNIVGIFCRMIAVNPVRTSNLHIINMAHQRSVVSECHGVVCFRDLLCHDGWLSESG